MIGARRLSSNVLIQKKSKILSAFSSTLQSLVLLQSDTENEIDAKELEKAEIEVELDSLRTVKKDLEVTTKKFEDFLGL